MWSIFEVKCVKVVSFSILHDFASTDVDALKGLRPMAPLEFLVSLFPREDLLFILPKIYKVIPLKNNIYIYIYKSFF